MRRVAFAALCAAVLVATAAQAGDACRGSTQADLDMCADAAFGKADAALNETYRMVMARLQGTQQGSSRTALIKAQRAWLAFRDAECAWQASSAQGGSIYPMIVSQCRAGLTQARRETLARFLNCAEGDMGCPVPHE